MKTLIGKKILAALRDFGGYLDDNTASNSGAFNVEGGVVEEVMAAYDGLDLRNQRPGDNLYDDLVEIYRALAIVDNNGERTKGGGGVGRRPRAAEICGAQGGA